MLSRGIILGENQVKSEKLQPLSFATHLHSKSPAVQTENNIKRLLFLNVPAMLWCQALEQIPKPSEKTLVAKQSHMLNSSSQQACSTTEKNKENKLITFCPQCYFILEYIIMFVDCFNNLSQTKVLENFEVVISRN